MLNAFGIWEIFSESIQYYQMAQQREKDNAQKHLK